MLASVGSLAARVCHTCAEHTAVALSFKSLGGALGHKHEAKKEYHTQMLHARVWHGWSTPKK